MGRRGGDSRDQELDERIHIVEAALRLQDATGSSHLQQLEMDPEAYGLDKATRPRIKKLRQRRNQALHGTRRHLLKDEAVDTKQAVETSTDAPTHDDPTTSNDTTSSHVSSNEAVAVPPSVYGGPFCVRCAIPYKGSRTRLCEGCSKLPRPLGSGKGNFNRGTSSVSDD